SRLLNIRFNDLLTIVRKQHHQRVYSLLTDSYLQVLTGGHGDLVEMRLTAGKLSFDGLAGFQRKLFIGALRRAAGAIACLRRQGIRRRPRDYWQSDPGEQDDNENDGAASLQPPHLRD